MSIAQDWPTAMVVLASEQLWPNIHGLAHWRPNLQHLFIYRTGDTRSAPPAQRLQALCREIWPNLCVECQPGDMQPQAVIAQINAWRQAHPNHRWLLNATGGTKLMHDGLVAFVGQADTEVVYRELDGLWYRFNTGTPLETTQIEVPTRCTDAIPVERLIRAQWHVENMHIEFGLPPAPLNWAAALDAGCRTRWDWRAVRSAAGDTVRDGNGLFFERLVESLIRAMGLTNLTRNVRRTAQGQQLQEIDLVVNHAGRMLILDCKLVGEEGENERGEPITSQIRQAQQTSRALGGLGSGLLMIRPNRAFSEEEKELVKSYGLHTLDQEGCQRFLTQLAEFSKTDLTPELRDAEERMVTAWDQDRVRPFCQEQPPRRFAPPSFDWNSEAVVDLDAFRQQYEGQDWVAYQFNQQIHIAARVPAGMEQAEADRRIRALFASLGSPRVTFSGTGGFCQIVLQRSKAAWPALRTLLESRLRRALLE